MKWYHGCIKKKFYSHIGYVWIAGILRGMEILFFPIHIEKVPVTLPVNLTITVPLLLSSCPQKWNLSEMQWWNQKIYPCQNLLEALIKYIDGEPQLPLLESDYSKNVEPSLLESDYSKNVEPWFKRRGTKNVIKDFFS